MLDRITIIIPTVARPAFVLRQFAYWKNLGPQVFILDGAPQPLEIPDELKSANVHYKHTGTKFNERLATASQFVHTDFCALLPDDEFYLPSGLRDAVQHLDEHPDVIGCVGRCLYFFVDQGRFLVRDAYRDWAPFPDDADTVEKRLDADLPPNKTHKAQFAILRSEAWKKMFETSYRTYYSCGYTYERFLNLQRTVLGRTDIIESLLWMRSMENPPISNESVPRLGSSDYLEWAMSTTNSNEVEHYRSAALSILKSGQITEELACAFEDRFFVGGIVRQQQKVARNQAKVSTKARRVAFLLSSKRVRLLVKRVIPNFLLRFTGWQGYDIDAIQDSLERRQTRFNLDELRRISILALLLDSEARGNAARSVVI